MGMPQNKRFLIENTIRLDDLGVPPVQETSICLFSISSSLESTILWLNISKLESYVCLACLVCSICLILFGTIYIFLRLISKVDRRE